VIVATKTELREDKETIEKLTQAELKPITPSEGQALANKYGVPYYEVSAMTGLNVKEVFDAGMRLGVSYKRNK
jgi:GTPase SAR1 family protein